MCIFGFVFSLASALCLIQYVNPALSKQKFDILGVLSLMVTCTTVCLSLAFLGNFDYVWSIVMIVVAITAGILFYF